MYDTCMIYIPKVIPAWLFILKVISISAAGQGRKEERRGLGRVEGLQRPELRDAQEPAPEGEGRRQEGRS